VINAVRRGYSFTSCFQNW